jgi:uncharacterized membrane protein YdjX (TVP38/TMEM64 family)
MKNKWLVIVLLLTIIAAAVLSGAGDYLNLEYLKQQRVIFQVMYAESPLMVVSGYFLLYLLVATFSIPGAAVLTIGCGALFGFFVGTLIGSFASSIGALLAFWIVRFIARDGFQTKFAKQLAAVNQGVQDDGAFYLFGLRLVPVLPFFLVNILMALTPIKSWTFYSVSQVGMLAGTMVYVNAGTRLAEIDSLSGILDPQLLFAFVLLAIFPIVARKVMQYLKRRA